MTTKMLMCAKVQKKCSSDWKTYIPAAAKAMTKALLMGLPLVSEKTGAARAETEATLIKHQGSSVIRAVRSIYF